MNKHFQEKEAIEKLLKKYFEAVYQADIETLKEIFHQSAAMYGYLGNDAVVGTPKIFFDDLASKDSMAKHNVECKCVVDSIEVMGNVAVASIFVDGFFGAATVKDYFHLLKENNQWHIVCKTFTTL